MKRLQFSILIVSIVCCNAALAQSSNSLLPDGNYWLVRHAEKDTGKNPVLSMAGYMRAGDLYRELKDKKINRIYVNQYKRIQLTADSLRLYQKIDTIHYNADVSGDGILKKLTAQTGDQGNVLIIGHSNTIPMIIKRLGITDLGFDEINENEYDNLYLVTIKNKQPSLKRMKFGKRLMPTAVPNQ
jgi:broad specificity phosphatase PhoE